MSGLTIKHAGEPDETRKFEDKGKFEIYRFDERAIGKGILKPGWSWSEHEKPRAGTESCEVAHVGYCVSGRIHVKMDDGEEAEVGPGDTFSVSPGHDAYVVGDDDFVYFEFNVGERGAAEETTKSTYISEEPAPPPAH